jgi:hypothetical protein
MNEDDDSLSKFDLELSHLSINSFKGSADFKTRTSKLNLPDYELGNLSINANTSNYNI